MVCKADYTVPIAAVISPCGQPPATLLLAWSLPHIRHSPAISPFCRIFLYTYSGVAKIEYTEE